MKTMTKELANDLLNRKDVYLTSEGEQLLRVLIEEVTSSDVSTDCKVPQTL
ncbi:hypothetical protein [Sutcliffiella halmapala]|uniref:hypothetical protein n=1 Tax=Sutcliffiella halmapala TaxID=79882 RepID=UPI0014767CB0|nr:hypothetical protein [Sutcliffiella halmapala]